MWRVAKQPINLRLDADLVAAADALAAATGIDRTELVARGLRRELLYEGGREFIYVLSDESGEVRYVGRSRDPYKRLREHIAAARAGGQSAKEAWLAAMLAEGQAPSMAIIDDAEPGEAVAMLEADWIMHFAEGGRLTNGVSAGIASGLRRVGKRRQIGMIDESLLDAIDADAERRGETRRAWIERTSRAALNGPALAAMSTDETPRPSPAGRKAKTEVASRPARSAATARQSASRPSTSPRASAARPSRSERAIAAARAEFEAARTAKQAKLNKAKGL